MRCCWLRPPLNLHLKERTISDDARAARLLHTRLLTLAASVDVRGGECGVRAKEFSGSYRKALKTLTFREAHVLERYP